MDTSTKERVIVYQLIQDPKKHFTVNLKLSLQIKPHSQMTVLLFLKDYIRNKLQADSLTLYFDQEGDLITNEEEVLQEQSIEQVYVKAIHKKQAEAHITDMADELMVAVDVEDEKVDEQETIYVNHKNQLVKITPQEKNGRMIDLHQILSFDVDKLPQSSQHKYGGEDDASMAGGGLSALPRSKVPVKDGMSQSKFLMQSLTKSGLVENPNDVFYTMEDVAKHNKDDDCWTVLNGKVYDVTQYAKVHPGGRKIFLGKGKDCTSLYNQYHPWVNGAVLIGKYQVGMLKK